MGVEQGTLELGVFEQIAVRAHLHLGARAEQREVAEDGGVVPPVGLALEPLQDALEGGAHKPRLLPRQPSDRY